jgi:uncharacterized metal-binding protein YceD (DUF177 family)
MASADLRWHVPVRLDDVPETGLHLALAADEAARANLRTLAALRELPRLEAQIDIVRRGNGLHASGRLSATVGQICVVTLEPIEGTVEEAIDVAFLPASAELAAATQHDGDEAPEPLVDGVADIGAVVSEFFLLGIDRYPRKPGAVFASPVAEEGGAGASGPSPFAALAKLKKADKA